ncbi:MAG: hypothetical protein FWD49_05640 [Firmicutes bacterium]|nr:hypothetical protein [Bacillota bacterium]
MKPNVSAQRTAHSAQWWILNLIKDNDDLQFTIYEWWILNLIFIYPHKAPKGLNVHNRG